MLNITQAVWLFEAGSLVVFKFKFRLQKDNTIPINSRRKLWINPWRQHSKHENSEQSRIGLGKILFYKLCFSQTNHPIHKDPLWAFLLVYKQRHIWGVTFHSCSLWYVFPSFIIANSHLVFTVAGTAFIISSKHVVPWGTLAADFTLVHWLQI